MISFGEGTLFLRALLITFPVSSLNVISATFLPLGSG